MVDVFRHAIKTMKQKFITVSVACTRKSAGFLMKIDGDLMSHLMRGKKRRNTQLERINALRYVIKY